MYYIGSSSWSAGQAIEDPEFTNVQDADGFVIQICPWGKVSGVQEGVVKVQGVCSTWQRIQVGVEKKVAVVEVNPLRVTYGFVIVMHACCSGD